MMTSIPYEPGWTVKVDGKRVDNLIEETKNEDGSTTLSNKDGDTGQIVVVDAMIGIRLNFSHGTHDDHKKNVEYIRENSTGQKTASLPVRGAMSN